jgi:hypothetical protein
MNTRGEIQKSRYSITRLQESLDDPRMSIEDRMRVDYDIQHQKQHVEKLERARLKKYK